uniref:Glutathione synthetase n=1 Tax=Aureoumbra lagunensis TaxID=44058 RepID=A0A7S3NG18_9STRA|mmetsp:Transcript_7794/g.11809  ORF Transcript_7794/g.11809 Transcript_7794/m.11809 type:complete len:519 (-) Transcript_7794:198-1754(-)
MRLLTYIANLGVLSSSSRESVKIQVKEETMASLGIEESMVPEAVSWMIAHGGVYALPSIDMEKLDEKYQKGGAFNHAPFALAPFPWPLKEYEKVKNLQPTINRIIDRVSRNSDWLHATLKETVVSDDFTRRLLHLYDNFPNPQSLALGLLRSDYMLDEPSVGENEILDYPDSTRSLQVEINTIASSFACLSETVSNLHIYLNEKVSAIEEEKLPLNPAGQGMAAAIAAAHNAYCTQQNTSNPKTVVMIVQPGERNQMDQRKLEHWLWSNHNVRLIRLSLAQIAQQAQIQEDQGCLILKNHLEVSVVYYRAGYSPNDYPTETEWSARQLIETSLAIKCPSAAYHLVGTKKVQQALAAPGQLEHFLLPTDPPVTQVRQLFAGLFDLDQAAGHNADKAVNDAIASPHAFVLKPQREGGGNNLYDQQLVDALQSMIPAQRSAYILMERINSKPRTGALVRDAILRAGPCIAELGIYGTILTDGPNLELYNTVPGHLLRQKLLGVNEGGVAAGFAVLSSPKLV